MTAPNTFVSESTGTSGVRPAQKSIVQMMRENLADIREQGGTLEDQLQEVRKWQRRIQNVNEMEAFRNEVASSMGPSIVSMLDAGTSGLAGIVTDAMSPGSFRANRDARQAVYEAMPTSDRVLSSVAGGFANPLNYAIPAAPASAGALRTVGQGMASGAVGGAAQAVGENIGTTRGATMPGVSAGVAGAVVGGALSPLARALTRSAPAGANVVDDMVQPTSLREVLEANARDLNQYGEGLQVPRAQHRTGRLTLDPPRTPFAPVPDNYPTPMAIDVAGPDLRALARGATGTVAGREALRGPFAARAAQAPQALEQAFDAATGTTAKDADALAVQLANAERGLATANAAQKAQYEALVMKLRQQHANAVQAARAVQRPPAPQPVTTTAALDALEREAPPVDVVQRAEQMAQERSVFGQRAYGDAAEATKGVPVDDPAMDEFLRTPIGQKMWREEQAARANKVWALNDRSRNLPTVEKWDGPELVDAAVPDQEALHNFKRRLAEMARLSPDAKEAAGIAGESVATAGEGLRTRLRPMLDSPYLTADAGYAERKRLEDALAEGLVRRESLPDDLSQSLSAMERASRTPEETALFRTGVQERIRAMLAGGMSPATLADALADPRTDFRRYARLGFEDDALDRLAAAFRTPDPTPFTRPTVAPFVAPPKPSPLTHQPDIVATLRGVDVPNTPAYPTAGAPARSLPTLAQDVAGMSPAEREGLQRGAAMGFRRNIGSIDLTSPEGRTQFGYAAQSPSLADAFGGSQGAWQTALTQQSRVLPPGQLGVGPEAESLLHRVFEGAAVNPGYAAIRTGRELTSKGMDVRSPIRQARDRAVGESVTLRPESLADALAWQLAHDDEVARAGRRAATMGGGLTGSMMSPVNRGENENAKGTFLGGFPPSGVRRRK